MCMMLRIAQQNGTLLFFVAHVEAACSRRRSEKFGILETFSNTVFNRGQPNT